MYTEVLINLDAFFTISAFFIGGQLSHLVHRAMDYEGTVWGLGFFFTMPNAVFQTFLYAAYGQIDVLWVALAWFLLVGSFGFGWILSKNSEKFGESANYIVMKAYKSIAGTSR